MVGDNRQGYAIVAAMAIMAIGSIVTINVLQGLHHGTVPQAVGAATEGTESRFGVLQLGDLRRRDHADLDRFGELVPRLLHRARRRRARSSNMMLGEVAPGGTGAGPVRHPRSSR